MQLLKFSHFGEGVRQAHSLRLGGVSSGIYESLNLGLDVGDSPDLVEENYRRFSEAIGFNLDALCVAHQEHTDVVLRVDEGAGVASPFSGIDGFVTDVVGVPLMVRFADCQGLLYFDPVRRVIAAVHSGWRGNAKNIVGKAVQKMVAEYGCCAADILVGVSASLGPCHAEFSHPREELPAFMHRYISEDGKHVNLWDCCFDELVAEGVLDSNIEMFRRCTVCENDKFFSFRVAKQAGFEKSGHMGAVIELV